MLYGGFNLMKRKILIFLCFILCIISLANVSATDEISEITEITDNDDNVISASQDDVVNELLSENQAINSDSELKTDDNKNNDSLNADNQVKETKFNLHNLTMYYKDGRRFSGNLVDSDGNPLSDMTVFVTVNGVNRTFITDKNGGFSFAVNLIPGFYPVEATFLGVPGYLGSFGVSFIHVKQTLYATNLTKYYGNPLKFIVLVSQNRTLEDIKLSFNINGVMYYRTTGLLGTASLAINLIPGTYRITVERLDTGERLGADITVKPLLTENKKVEMFYRNGSTYDVKVILQNGSTSGPGEKVTFNINGILYTRTTDEKGIARLRINLAQGDYIVTAEYKGYKVSNNIKVKPVISASDLTKTYGTPDPFVAKIVDGQGRPDSGKIVRFNINGVFYNATTDSEGAAKLNINLMPGQYIITSISPNGNTISNKIVVKDANTTSGS